MEFVIRSPWRREKRVVFQADTPEIAELLAMQLIQRAQPVDQERSRAIREFNMQLRAASGRLVITPVLVIVTLLAYVSLAVVTRQWEAFDLPTLIQWGANSGELTVNGQWWRLLSAGLLHANLAHLLLNMWALWNIGRITERLFGRLRFLSVYLATLVLASLSSIAWNPSQASVGASGAIFGVLGAFLAFFLSPRTQVPRTLARQHWLSTGIFVLFNLLSGMANPVIDNAAHVGGLLSGFALGWVLARPLQNSARSTRSWGQLATAVGVVVACGALGLWQVKGRGSELTPTEQYMKGHSAYVADESKNLRLWMQLAQRAADGSISSLELGQRFEKEILPFWNASYASFAKERASKSVPAAQQPFAALVYEFVSVRKEWAEKIIEFTKDQDMSTEAVALSHKNDLLQARLERMGLRSAMAHRPRALASNPLVMKLRHQLSLSGRHCIDPPTVIAPSPNSNDNANDGPTVRHRLGCQAQQLFLDADYSTLDAMMSRALRTLGDLPDGSSSYQGMADGLVDLFDYGGKDFRELLGGTADWRAAVPGSIRPEVMEADVFYSLAWAVRGHGFASSVTPQAWAIFAYRIEMAAAALDDIRVKAQGDPYWHQLAINIGSDQKLGEESLGALYETAAKRFPFYLPLVRARLRMLMPRWGGSYERVDDFINSFYRQAPEGIGLERYATLYWRYAVMEGDEVDLFADTHAYWSGMRTGFQGLTKRHPASDYILNQFANSACRANDRQTYLEQRPLLRTRYFSTAWTQKYSLDACDKKLAPAAAVRTAAKTIAPADDAPSAAVSLSETQQKSRTLPYMTFDGVRLGMTANELLAAKGPPLSKLDGNWRYNTVDAKHEGVITVGWREAGGVTGPVVSSVEYSGDENSAPKDVPFLKGEAKGDLFSRYGNPVDMRLHDDLMNYQFANGVVISARDDRVVYYGITLPKQAK